MEWPPARLRLLRAEGLCLSQDELTAELGFVKRTVGNAERGIHPPSLALRRALDRALEKASDAQRDRFLATTAAPAVHRTNPIRETVELLRLAEASDLGSGRTPRRGVLRCPVGRVPRDGAVLVTVRGPSAGWQADAA